MHTKLDDWKNGWFGIELGIRPEEIASLIESLRMLQRDHDQHFHISSDGKGSSGVGDIMVYVQPQDELNNMESPSSRALAPGESIDDPKT
jgi:hypothetical protein